MNRGGATRASSRSVVGGGDDGGRRGRTRSADYHAAVNEKYLHHGSTTNLSRAGKQFGER
jgi:hypothetical protein